MLSATTEGTDCAGSSALDFGKSELSSKRGRLAVWTGSDGYGVLSDRSCPRISEMDTTGCVDASSLSRGIDFVGEDVVFECLDDGLIETGQQLGQSLALAAHEHRQGVVLVGGHGDAADRVHLSERDFAIVDELGDVRQGQEVDHGVAIDWPLLYAAAWFASDRLGATFHGSNSSMRDMG